MATRFRYLPVASSLGDGAVLRHVAEEYGGALRELGGQATTVDEALGDLPPVFFVVTGGTERLLLDLVERRGAGQAGPTLLLAHRGHNSLPASLEVLARLRQDGLRGRILYLDGPSDRDGLLRLRDAVHDLAVRFRLQRARIGAIGAPSDWLIASSPEPQAVRQTWGVQIVPVFMEALSAGIDGIADDEASVLAKDALARATDSTGVSDRDAQEAASVHAALRRIVAREKLDALSLRCFDLLQSRRTTGCLALAQLNDDGIVAGCEGDLASTIGMCWAQALLERPAWMANPARLDERHDTLWLAHCTVPRTMLAQYRLRTHFESGLGLAIQGRLPEGPATLFRLGGRCLDRLWASDAEVVASGTAQDLCRTQVEVRLLDGRVGDLLRDPLGNHLVLVQGHHAVRLRDWMALMV